MYIYVFQSILKQILNGEIFRVDLFSFDPHLVSEG